MSAPPPQSARPRVAALDGLRGLAVVAVLLFHGGYLSGGFLGVDLFFVLSGYLITALLLREWGARGTIGLGQFWSSRARRLLPALLLAAFVVVIGSHLFAAPGTLATLRGDLVGTLTYTANWRFVARGHELLDGPRSAVAAPTRLEPGDRGAVLPALARSGHRAPASGGGVRG